MGLELVNFLFYLLAVNNNIPLSPSTGTFVEGPKFDNAVSFVSFYAKSLDMMANPIRANRMVYTDMVNIAKGLMLDKLKENMQTIDTNDTLTVERRVHPDPANNHTGAAPAPSSARSRAPAPVRWRGWKRCRSTPFRTTARRSSGTPYRRWISDRTMSEMPVDFG